METGNFGAEDVDTVGRNKKTIQEYIKNQLQEDIMEDQMTMKEFIKSEERNKKSRFSGKARK